IGFRPMRSDSHPKKMSDGVAMSSATPVMIAGLKTSGFITCCRKYSAQNWPLYHTTPSPITTMLAITTYLTLALRNASFQGFAAILAAEAQSLNETKPEEQKAGRRADLRVTRDDADERGGYAHAAERDQERVLATHEIADAAEEERSERADQESCREGPDGLDQPRPGPALREELYRQDRGQAAEDVKIVPLDHVSDGCGDDDSAELLEGQL